MDTLLKDWEQLKSSKRNKSSGMKLVHHFFDDAMSRMRNRDGFTKAEWIEKHREKGYVQRMVKHWVEVKKGTEQQGLDSAFQLYSRSGSMTSQLPHAIIDCIQAYYPAVVYDPCAGWGARLLGAVSQGCAYIGCDTNITLRPAYEQMVDMLGVSGSVQMFWQDSASLDVSGYDMVYTSPPYWTKHSLIERYEHQPEEQATNGLSKFLKPMFARSWSGLNPGGVLCLNMKPCMYEDLGIPCQEVRELPTRRARRGKDVDMVYVWKKP